MRLDFNSYGTPYPFIASAFAPSTYARAKGVAGLGLDQSTNTAAAIAAQGAATTGAIVQTLYNQSQQNSGSSSDGSGGGNTFLSHAGEIGAIIQALVGIGLAIANLFKGCGQTCVLATQDANQLETYWQTNLNQYMNAPVHYYSLQQAALNNFDTGWAALYKACSDPALGAAGQRCISERQRGGASAWCCNATVHTDVGNGMCTGCDAFVTFRDPIANDPNVVPDPVAGASVTGGSVTGSTGGFPMLLLLIGGGILAFTMMGGD